MPQRRAIGDSGAELVRRKGARVHGVTIPEVQELFNSSKDGARRFVLRLCKYGILERTEKRRRRWDIFGDKAGAGGIVYRAVRTRPLPILKKGPRRRMR